MSLDDVADRFQMIGVQVHEQDFVELALYLDSKQPDPLKMLMFASGYIGWAIAKLQDQNADIPASIVGQLPLMVAQCQMRIYIETRKKINEQKGESGAPPQGPG